MSKQGQITCAKCGSWTRTTKKPYGGLRRVVCVNASCSESEEQSFANDSNV